MYAWTMSFTFLLPRHDKSLLREENGLGATMKDTMSRAYLHSQCPGIGEEVVFPPGSLSLTLTANLAPIKGANRT